MFIEFLFAFIDYCCKVIIERNIVLSFSDHIFLQRARTHFMQRNDVFIAIGTPCVLQVNYYDNVRAKGN